MNSVIQNFLQQLKRIIINYLNTFKFVFHRRKQIEIIRNQIIWIRQLRHANYIVFFWSILIRITSCFWYCVLSRRKIGCSSELDRYIRKD
jgi:hypothetical protein